MNRSDGIDIVVSNPCTLAFSYRINGPTVEYLGAKDKHDHKYNSLRQESRLDKLGRFAIHGSGYTGAVIDISACPLTFSPLRFRRNEGKIFVRRRHHLYGQDATSRIKHSRQ
jgi:hypothetical protein